MPVAENGNRLLDHAKHPNCDQEYPNAGFETGYGERTTGRLFEAHLLLTFIQCINDLVSVEALRS